jgi:hypothetical protein
VFCSAQTPVRPPGFITRRGNAGLDTAVQPQVAGVIKAAVRARVVVGLGVARLPGVGIAAAGEPDRERVDPDLLLLAQSLGQAAAHRGPPLLAGSAADVERARQSRGRHLLEIGELIAGGDRRGGLGVPLDLVHLAQRLPQRAAARVLGVQFPAVAVGRVEHRAAAGVGVVRDGHHVAGAAAGGLQPVPQLLGVGRLIVAQRQVRHVITAEDYHPVQVDAVGGGRPLKADQRGEPARVIMAVSDLHHPPPDGLPRRQHLRAEVHPRGLRVDHPGEHSLGRGADIPRPAVVTDDTGVAVLLQALAALGVIGAVVLAEDQPELTQPLRVVGDRGEVQRPLQPRLLSIHQRRMRRRALGEPECLIRPVQRGQRVGVQRPGRVHVQIAEIRVAGRDRCAHLTCLP